MTQLQVDVVILLTECHQRPPCTKTESLNTQILNRQALSRTYRKAAACVQTGSSFFLCKQNMQGKVICNFNVAPKSFYLTTIRVKKNNGYFGAMPTMEM